MAIRKIISAILLAFFIVITIPFAAPAMQAHATCPNGIYNNGLGGISIDVNAAPYNDSRWSAYGEPYGPGGCTWFVGARVMQLTGKGGYNTQNPTAWYNSYGESIGLTKGTSWPTGKAVLVYSNHVAILEKTDGDTAYISEGGCNGYGTNANYGYTIIRTVTKSEALSGLIGFVYLTNSTIAPTIANVSVSKIEYAVDEVVTFNITADGDTTHLWIYCPNGQTLTYENVGSTVTLGFGMSGYYEGLVETWNGIGSKKSSRISWRVGAPTICNLSIAKSNYAVDENVTFNMSVDGNKTNLWIYCPNGQVLTYTDVGTSYNLGFGMSGHFEALAETWNGNGSKQSSRVSWYVGVPQNAALAISKNTYKLNEKVSFDIKTDGTSNKLIVYYPDGSTKTYNNVGSSYETAFTTPGNYEAVVQASNVIGSKNSNKVSFTVEETSDPCSVHSWGQEVITKKATCTESGTRKKTCSVCGHEVTETIPAAGHKWNSTYTVDKKATYAAAGSKSIHCSVCGAKKPGSTVSIPKLTVKATTITKVTAAKKGFTVKWKKGTGINGYEVQYALNSTFTKGKKVVTITKPGIVSKKVSKLKAKKKYFVRIRTYKTVSGKKYYSAWSKAKAVITKK